MRFPSLHSLAGDAWRSFRRFPVAILLAAKAVILGMRWTHLIQHSEFDEVPGWYWDVIVSCYLGMLLSIAATVWVEKRGNDRRMSMVSQTVVLGLVASYYWSLPPSMTMVTGARTLVLALGLHWLIAVIAFRGSEVNGFWQFNKRLFLRVLTAYLYTMVLYIGFTLALLAVDKLFNANVRIEVYEDCWWVFGGLFSVWFFLAGFPGAYDNPEVIADYPKGLKIFTQYVLLTLVTVYLLILYAYMFKIIITARWPVGWVAWMVMALAVAGILSLLLIYPLRNDADNAWVRGYSKFFYIAQLPLIVLLFVATFKRITPYGITEQRYFLLLLSVWLLGITIYFLVSTRKDIRLVPLSLCILAFLCCWGPWGAFSVSLRSQENRLVRLLEKDGLMADGKVVAAKPGAIKLKDRQAISSGMDYLVEQHGYKVLQPIFRENLDSLMRSNDLTKRSSSYRQVTSIMDLMNIKYSSRWDYAEDSVGGQMALTGFECEPERDVSATLTGGAMYLANFSLDVSGSDVDSARADSSRLTISLESGRNVLHLSWRSTGGEASVDLAPVTRRILRSNLPYQVVPSKEEMELPFEGANVTGKVLLTGLRGTRKNSVVRFSQVCGTVLYSKK